MAKKNKAKRPTGLKSVITQQEVAAQPKRPLKDIEAEYTQLCQAAGDRQYRLEVLKSELNQLNGRMLQLNQEASVVKHEEAQAAQKSVAAAAGSAKQPDASLQ